MSKEVCNVLFVALTPTVAILAYAAGSGEIVSGIIACIIALVFLAPIFIAYIRDNKNILAIAAINLCSILPLAVFLGGGVDMASIYAVGTAGYAFGIEDGVGLGTGATFSTIGWIVALVMSVWNNKK